MESRSIKKNAVFNSIKTVSSVIFPLITFPYISRTLLVDNVGKIQFGLTIISYFSLIATLGINTYAIRECAKARNSRESLDKIASQIFSINVITTVVAYLALFVTLYVSVKLNKYRDIILIQSLTILATTVGADWLNSAMEDFKYITIRTIVFQAIGVLLMLIFVHEPDDYIKYVFISLFSVAGPAIINVWYRRKFARVRIVTNLEIKKHFLPILFLFVMIMAQSIFNNVDMTMLGLKYGDYEVGIYSTAYKLENIITQVIVSIAWVAMPRLSQLFEEKRTEEINSLLSRIYGFFCLVGLPCIIGATLLSRDIILLAAGEEYIESIPILQVLMLGYIPNLFGGSLWGNMVLLPSKKEKEFMIICCIAAGVNVLLNYLLIPIMSTMGAALATVACNAFIFLAIVIRKDRDLKLSKKFKHTITPIIGCFGIVLVCSLCYQIPFLPLRVFVSIIFSVIIYFAIQIVGKNELTEEALSTFLNKLKIGK